MKPKPYPRLQVKTPAKPRVVIAGAAKGPGALLARALAAGMPLFESGSLSAQCAFRVHSNVHAFSLGDLPAQPGRAERSKTPVIHA